jgi:predicted RNA-binding protein YlqC (UPF0109 family)
MSEATTSPAAAATPQKGDLRLLIESVVKQIVDHPDEVAIETEQDGDITVFNLRVAQKDIGKVIGKQGRTVRSLRTLLDAAGAKQNLECELEIIEEDDDDQDDDGPDGNRE